MSDSPQSYHVTDVTALSAGKPKWLTLKQAAGIAGVSPDTIARWCKKYGIGKQLHSKAPWRVDPVGLAIVMAGDADRLAEYLRKDGRGLVRNMPDIADDTERQR